ncbi:hypothetical protein [Ascidiaceihabitans sp.]|uniref:hypothetical protein n=1 Tax=Ascidiaceihabitans sp. TaxID=1872644 RepID=UPI0032981E81
MDLERHFTVDYDEGVGWSFSLAESAEPENKHFGGEVDHAIAALDGKGGFKAGLRLEPTLRNLSRVLNDVCVVGWDMERAAQKAAAEALATLPKLPAALEKDKDLHRRLIGSSGALYPSGPRSLHEVDEMFAKVHAAAPWLRGATSRIWQATKARMMADAGGVFTVPPLLLYGPPGTGKSSLADLIAVYPRYVTIRYVGTQGQTLPPIRYPT